MKEKKLKLKIVKFKRTLVMQVLEMQNIDFSASPHVLRGRTDFGVDGIWIGDCIELAVRDFCDNAERDEYLQKILGWISEELFGRARKLEVGKMCEVSDDGKTWEKLIYASESLPPLNATFKFLTLGEPPDEAHYIAWKYARPISEQLTIDGDVYTWEDK